MILDSGILIAAERHNQTTYELLEHLRRTYGDEVSLGLSVVSVAELMHGVSRAKSKQQGKRRLAFLDRLCSDVPVYPVTLEIARLIGQTGGEQAARGNALPFQDLVIGVTALYLGFDLLTFNVRDFQRIPGLTVLPA